MTPLVTACAVCYRVCRMLPRVRLSCRTALTPVFTALTPVYRSDAVLFIPVLLTRARLLIPRTFINSARRY